MTQVEPAPVCSVGIRLQGPMQSWAMIGRGAIRGTHTRPTKAGVIGLIANALGRDWADDITDLAQLRFGVRVDHPGILEVDYHTTGSGHYYALSREVAYAPTWWGDTRTADPSDPGWMNYAPPRDITSDAKTGALTSNKANPSITNDHYLAGANFLAAVQSTDIELLHRIAAALAAPARALFLGRKAYGPSAPLLDSVAHAPIEELFAAAPPPQPIVNVYIEPHPDHPGQVIHDQPISFNGPTRRAARLETHYVLDGDRPDNPPEHTTGRDADAGATDSPTLFDDLFHEGTTT